MSGGEVEQEVILDVDGGAVGRAFDGIEARIKAIQTSIDKVQQKARAAADAFGGNLQKTITDLNKTVSTLERFQKTVDKYDPNAIKARETEQVYRQGGIIQREEAKKSDDYDRALAATRSQREKEIARTSDLAWQQNINSRSSMEARYEKLAEDRIARLNRTQLEADRKLDQQRLQDQRTFEQNRIKQARDVAQQNVANASPRQLAAMQAASSANLQDLRGQRGTGSADEQRRLEQDIVLEKEYLKLVQQRLDLTASADARINSGLDLRSGKLDEAALGQQLSLNAAKTRQADLEAGIAAQIARTYKLTGDEKIAAEQSLKIDEARLVIAKQRVKQLETEAAAQVRANKASTSSSGTGMFGGSGLLGVIGRTAAYGGAATAIYGTISALKDGISSAIEFQDSIAKIGGVAGLTSDQEVKLGEAIRQVAANSRFATNEIAEATMTLAQAGFSAEDIGKSLQNIANLAAASGVSMQEATDVVTSAIGAFQLQTSETGHIADVLSAALNTTKLNIQQVAQGIQYAGQTAYENKITFDELTAAMATMAQAGVKSGSTMGTGLRLFLTDLMTPTKKLGEEFKHLGISMEDIDVKTRGLPAVLATLSQKGFSAAEAFAGLDKRSAAAYLVLKNNQDVLQKQIVLVNQLGNSAEAAGKASESLAAEWQRFKNVVNEKVADAFGPMGKGIQDMLHSFNEIEGNDTLRKMRAELDNLDEGSKAWSDQVDAIEAYKAALEQNIQVVHDHADAIEKSQTAINEANDAFTQNQQTILAQDDAIARLIQHQSTLKSDTGALAAETASLMNRFQGLAAQVFDTASSYDNLLESMRKVRAESIALGALRATDQANAYDRNAHAKIAEANSVGQLIIGNGLYSRLPANVRDAINFARTHVNSSSAQDQLRLGEATQLISGYASDPRNKLKGYDADRLRMYAGNLSGAGVDFASKSTALSNAQMYRYLGGPSGNSLMTQYDNLTGKPQGVIKTALAHALDMAGKASRNGNPGLSSAWQQLATMAQAAMGSGEPPKVQGGGSKKKGGDLAGRQDRAVDAEAVKADAAELSNAIKSLLHAGGSTGFDGKNIIVGAERTLTPERLKQNAERIDKALEQWTDDRTQQVQDQMKHLKIDPNSVKGKNMLEDLQREIDAKGEEVHRQIGELLAKGLDKVVEGIGRATKRAEEAADQTMAMVDARSSALQRANLNGKVPDYVQATVERQAAFAKDDRDRQQISINDTTLARLTKARDDWSAIVDYLNTVGDLGDDDPAMKKLEELNDQIQTLSNSNAALKASFGGEGLIPKSFSANMQMAIANFREANHLGQSWTQMLEMNVTGALDTASNAFTQFFSDILSGNMSIAQSFGHMAKAIIGYIGQVIAKMIAMQLLEVALNLIGSAAGSKVSATPGYSQASSAHTTNVLAGLGFGGGKLYGGQIHALTGRYITDGVPNRDSVDAKIARGEYVTRKSAVDSVGVGFMNDLNNRGKAALAGFGPRIMMPAPAHQQMNVYVVQEDRPPSMGPKDVLVTIANDIYRNGPTKQLIKQVAQGG